VATKKAPQEIQDHLHLMAHHSMLALVPQRHRAKVDDLLAQARAKGVSPATITKAIMAIIMGGFTPEAFASAIAILFG
jgi:hypothetical protein